MKKLLRSCGPDLYSSIRAHSVHEAPQYKIMAMPLPIIYQLQPSHIIPYPSFYISACFLHSFSLVLLQFITNFIQDMPLS